MTSPCVVAEDCRRMMFCPIAALNWYARKICCCINSSACVVSGNFWFPFSVKC